LHSEQKSLKAWVHLAQLTSQFLHCKELRSANFPVGQELTQVELFKKVPKKHEEHVVALEVQVLHKGEHSWHSLEVELPNYPS
jgi:hypothetical protein